MAKTILKNARVVVNPHCEMHVESTYGARPQGAYWSPLAGNSRTEGPLYPVAWLPHHTGACS
jgi:hypothetical protein